MLTDTGASSGGISDYLAQRPWQTEPAAIAGWKAEPLREVSVSSRPAPWSPRGIRDGRDLSALGVADFPPPPHCLPPVLQGSAPIPAPCSPPQTMKRIGTAQSVAWCLMVPTHRLISSTSTSTWNFKNPILQMRRLRPRKQLLRVRNPSQPGCGVSPGCSSACLKSYLLFYLFT